MSGRAFVFLVYAAQLLTGSTGADDQTPAGASPDTLPPYVHPRANLVVWPPPGEDVRASDSMISPTAAAESAAVALLRRGVKDPLICEARWIPAAVSGYLVDALGDLDAGGGRYSVFRVGIRDGAEAQYGPAFGAGAVFTFFALGWDSAGAQIWYPPPGPDSRPSQDESFDELLPYEFLLDRAAFVTLATRFSRGADSE